MDKLKDYNTFINESVRDQMKPKSNEEIMKNFDKFHPMDMIIKGIDNNILWLVETGIDILENPSETLALIGDYHINRAIDKNYIEILKCLIEKGDYKIKEDALIYTIANGSIEMLKLLLNSGVKVPKITNQNMKYLFNDENKSFTEEYKDKFELLRKYNVDNIINKLKKLIK